MDNHEEMPKFMKPNTETDYLEMKIVCKFDKIIQSLTRYVIYKKSIFQKKKLFNFRAKNMYS